MSSRAGVLTRDGIWTADEWRVLRAQTDIGTDIRDSGVATELVLLPLALYLAQPQSAAHGVWLAPTDDPMDLQPHLQRVRRIAIDFPVFTDGRGYSIASTLRNRLHYSGELRAIGDILIDRCSFCAESDSARLRCAQTRTAQPPSRRCIHFRMPIRRLLISPCRRFAAMHARTQSATQLHERPVAIDS